VLTARYELGVQIRYSFVIKCLNMRLEYPQGLRGPLEDKILPLMVIEGCSSP
jgi:hypothetical protein